MGFHWEEPARKSATITGKGGHVMEDAKCERSRIGEQIVDDARNGGTDGIRAEVVIIDQAGKPMRTCARIFESAEIEKLTTSGETVADGEILAIGPPPSNDGADNSYFCILVSRRVSSSRNTCAETMEESMKM